MTDLVHLTQPRRTAAVMLLALVAAVATTSAVAAQATPPTRFFGTVTVDGRPAGAGTGVVGRVGAVVCGTAVVTADGSYVLDLASGGACGTNGAVVTFSIDDRLPARETALALVGGFIRADLTADTYPPPFRGTARVAVERWVRFREEPCASPVGEWCIQTFELPPAHEPYSRYRMLAFRSDGSRAEATPWIYVSPSNSTPGVHVTAERGVTAVVWERETPRPFAEPCLGAFTSEWCTEGVVVRPPLHAAAWYRLLVFHPNGTVEEPAGFVLASP